MKKICSEMKFRNLIQKCIFGGKYQQKRDKKYILYILMHAHINLRLNYAHG